MAYLGRYGSVSPSEFDDWDHAETMRYAREIDKLRGREIELFVNLAKVVALSRAGSGAAPEVRG